ncbi:MAG: DUF2585 family protein [Sulfitobacter sp.]
MTYRIHYIFAVLGIFIIAGTLYAWGQPMICTCGEVQLWIGSIYDSGNSQHIADWYTASHILHGVLIVLVGRVLFPRVGFGPLFLTAIITGVGWEVIEHTDFVLDAFRATTINVGYHGDSVLNAVADYIWMLGGFFTAYALRTPIVLGLVAVLELSAAFIARDSLALSTLMLIYPLDSVEAWQQEINPQNITN